MADNNVKDFILEEANVILGVTGSVATIKTRNIISNLKERIPEASVCLVPTEKALHFLPDDVVKHPEAVEADKIHTDKDEWTLWAGRGDPVLHIDLRKWADVLVIAPMDANTLAKVSNGLADNLLTCIARAWDFRSKLALFAPAMNTMMWEHPVTGPQVDTLKKWGFVEIPCVEKVLMCNDKGFGAMAEPETIADYVVKSLKDRSNAKRPRLSN